MVDDHKKSRKRRWGDKKTAETASAPAAPPPEDAKAKVLAMQASIKARLAAAKAKAARPVVATTTTTAVETKTQPVKRPAEEAASQPAKRAKHFELDLSTTKPTFEPTKPTKPAPKVNPYLSTADDDAKEDDANVDSRLRRAGKRRVRGKELNFVEPGHWQAVAEAKRSIAAVAQASGFVSGRKTGHTIHASSLAEIYGSGGGREEEETLPPLAAAASAHYPLALEWWDLPLLPSNLKKQVAEAESKLLTEQTKSRLKQLGSGEEATTNGAEHEELRTMCFASAALSYSKTASLVQHIVPVKPKSADRQAKAPVLPLTKKERKRQRKLRRQERQRDLQDRQAAGLIPAPEPRLTLKNFINVLGDQAFVDPSSVEQKVAEQMLKRQRAHEERNAASKLSKEERALKRTRKLQEDTSGGVSVAVFFVADLTHPYHRAKVDLNATQNNLTGGVIECESPPMAAVIVEGGPKGIKRYRRLMEVRMRWTGIDEDDESHDDEEEDADKPKFNPDNRCQLVWQGMAVKRHFKGFVFQQCETMAEARKVLKSKGLAMYWDQVVAVAKTSGSRALQLRLAQEEDEDGSRNGNGADDDEDMVMKDE